MKSIVVVDIHAPRDEVANLFADPSNNAKWMDEIERYEPVSGEQGIPGSIFRLVPKCGSMLFTATVVSRALPNEFRLSLDSSTVTVEVRGTLSTLPNGHTRLVSEEVFNFKSIWNKAFGLMAQPVIRKCIAATLRPSSVLQNVNPAGVLKGSILFVYFCQSRFLFLEFVDSMSQGSCPTQMKLRL